MENKLKRVLCDINWKDTIILFLVVWVGMFFMITGFTPDTLDDYAILMIKNFDPIYPLYIFRVCVGSILCIWVAIMTLFSIDAYCRDF